MIYNKLKYCQSISQFKKYSHELKIPVLSIESHLRYIFFFDSNLLVPGFKLNLYQIY